jgi:hypothetical protein
VEEQHGAARTHDGVQRPHLAMLIGQAEIGNAFADLRAAFRDVNRATRLSYGPGTGNADKQDD